MRFVIAVSAVLLAAACSAGPATKEDVCREFDELGTQMLRGNGIIGNPLFHAAESLADTADRYGITDISKDAKRLHEIADSDSTSVAELMSATTQISRLCGHPLGIQPRANVSAIHHFGGEQ
jgi:hypothetical protein